MEIPVYLASRNPHKCHEIEAIVRDNSSGSLFESLRILPCSHLNPEIKWTEDAPTYLENARVKIRAIRPHTSQRVIADDSGLEVSALGGVPGVHTSSFGGVEGDHGRNIKALLAKLEGVPEGKRQAAFVCLIVYEDLKGQEWQFQGRLEGAIALKPQGDGGFGYDPIFIPQGFKKTLAQLEESAKNAISHRGRAVELWKKHLMNELHP